MAWLAIGCFLVSSGADINHKNRDNKSPIDEVADHNIKDLLRKLVKYVTTALLLLTCCVMKIEFVETSVFVRIN